MSQRLFCDRCGDECFHDATLRVWVEAGSGMTVFALCERCCVSLRIWVENRPYSLLPSGAAEPLERDDP